MIRDVERMNVLWFDFIGHQTFGHDLAFGTVLFIPPIVLNDLPLLLQYFQPCRCGVKLRGAVGRVSICDQDILSLQYCGSDRDNSKVLPAYFMDYTIHHRITRLKVQVGVLPEAFPSRRTFLLAYVDDVAVINSSIQHIV